MRVRTPFTLLSPPNRSERGPPRGESPGDSERALVHYARRQCELPRVYRREQLSENRPAGREKILPY